MSAQARTDRQRSMMRLRQRLRECLDDGLGGEAGSAVVEFVFLGTLLLVPTVYFVISVSQVQAASFAVVNAADQAAKVYAGSDDATAGSQAAHQAALFAGGDFGIGSDQLDVKISCGNGACLEAGSSVTAEVSISVPLPLLGGTGLSMATVSSSATQIVERFG
ncbi:hypothetical protein ACWF5H_13960 [Arthrobacter sp. NPDC055138]